MAMSPILNRQSEFNEIIQLFVSDKCYIKYYFEYEWIHEKGKTKKLWISKKAG